MKKQALDFEQNDFQETVDQETGEVLTETMPAVVKEDEIEAIVHVAAGNYDEMIAQLDMLDDAEATIVLKAKYHSFESKGEKVRGFFMGYDELTKNELAGPKKLEVVQLLTKEGMKYLGGNSLTPQFKQLIVGMPVEVTYTGKEKTSSQNEVKTFDVRLLKLKTK